jgi:hypothetical protein
MTTTASLLQDQLPIYLRAYIPPPSVPTTRKSEDASQGEPEYALIFDTETTIDERQALRFGVYQFRKGDQLVEKGIFYEPEGLTTAETKTVTSYAKRHKLRLMNKAEFVDDVFYGMAYDLRAAIVGFNLPFDISRLANCHSTAHGKTMGGGFTFQLSDNPWKPRVQVKHLNGRAALIQLSNSQRGWARKSVLEGNEHPPVAGDATGIFKKSYRQHHEHVLRRPFGG